MDKKIVVLALALSLGIFILLFSYTFFGGYIKREPDFDISANPQSLILNSYKGSSNQTIITLGSINGFEGDITLSVSRSLGVIGDVRVDLDFYQVHLPANGQVTVRLALYVTTAIAPGDYDVQVFANASDFNHSISVSIHVPE